jgi:serine/threonine-protein kinase
MATGGSGAVFAARGLAHGEEVAIKVLNAESCADPDLRERFLREAGTASRMQSKHVAKVLDVGALESGTPYIVFERLDGADLADVLAEQGSLPIAEAVTWVLQACEAVAEAHSLGIIHRDLKPENLFLARGPNGSVSLKVIDFGISKIVRPSWCGRELSLTRSQVLMGSPKYMAPEQLRAAQAADSRSDVWSLGVVLYELIAGRAPFDAESLADLCAAVLKEEAVPLRMCCPDVPEALEAVVMRCLDKSPDRRFRDAAALGEAVAPFAMTTCGDITLRIPLVTPARPPPSFASMRPVAASVPPPDAARSRRFTAAAVAVASGLLVGMVLLVSLGSPQADRCAAAMSRVQEVAFELRDTAAREEARVVVAPQTAEPVAPSRPPTVRPANGGRAAPSASASASAKAGRNKPAPRRPAARPRNPAPRGATWKTAPASDAAASGETPNASAAPTTSLVPLWSRD